MKDVPLLFPGLIKQFGQMCSNNSVTPGADDCCCNTDTVAYTRRHTM